MLEETASVVSLKGDRATVALVRSDACGGCSAKNMCHPSSGDTMQMEVRNLAGAHPGDKVIISLPPGDLIKASATAYLMPAVAAVAGGAVGWSRYGTDGAAIVGTVIGFGLATLYLFWQGRKKQDSIPFISRVL
ncbi:MAG: SoxR reducing system RseC family protein [bacterium]|nr:MAG: SoxR reducing system RseC family protein [bacterium]